MVSANMLLLLVLIVIAAVYIRSREAENAQPCSTQGCVTLAADIMRAIDRSVSPCQDFFQFSCGNWNHDNPIPEDKARWGTFSVLNQKNQLVLKTILEQPLPGGSHPNPSPDDATTKARNFYAACMDTDAIDARGATPVLGVLSEVTFGTNEDGVWSGAEREALMHALVLLHQQNVDVLFGFGVGQDDKDSSKTAVFVQQGGLGLPSREYYFADATSDKVILAYKTHMRNLFRLVGHNDGTVADRVFAFEAALANVSVPRDVLRDPELTYNVLSVAELSVRTPLVDWPVFFGALFATPSHPVTSVIVNAPSYLAGLESVLRATATALNKGVVAEYLQWHALLSYADHLSQDFRTEDATFNHALLGVSGLPPRWQTCVARTDAALGFVLGKMFVDVKFPGQSKTVAQDMLRHIFGAFEANLHHLPWLTNDSTIAAALEKAEHVMQKIGYPDFINDAVQLNQHYASLHPIASPTTADDGYFEAIQYVRQFDVLSNLGDYGKPGRGRAGRGSAG